MSENEHEDSEHDIHAKSSGSMKLAISNIFIPNFMCSHEKDIKHIEEKLSVTPDIN